MKVTVLSIRTAARNTAPDVPTPSVLSVTARPLRLLFVLSYYVPYIGGAEYVFSELTRHLAQRGHHVKVITTRLPDTAAHEVIAGVEVERVAVLQYGDRYLFGLASIPTIARQIADYDLLHTASHTIAPPAALLARRARRPVVFTSHEVLGARWQRVEPSLLKRFVFQHFEQTMVQFPYHAYVAVSAATRRDMLAVGVPDVTSSVIYWGIDPLFLQSAAQPDGGVELREQLGIAPDDFVYLYYGRPGSTKGVNYLLAAAPVIQQAVPRAHLVLILGQKPPAHYAALCEQAAALRGQARIHIVPPFPERSQLVAALREADCIVVPSVTEGFGFTTAEASALGVPVVATRTGSIPEVVAGKHTLVPPRSAEALASGVIRAARGDYDADTPLRDFRWERAAAEYEALYRKLVP